MCSLPSFSSLSSSTFGTVVRARQALVVARQTLEALEAADTCPGRCKCSLRSQIHAAIDAERAAADAVAEREASWAEYLSLR